MNKEVFDQPGTVVILGTGGTIAGRAASSSDNIGYSAAEVGIDQLVSAIPSLAENGPIVTEQVAQLDSKDMSFEVWAALAGRVQYFLSQPEVAGVVITHGTDTLEETAYFLQAVCRPEKPVVLTCAMRPATALVPDGPQNVIDAVAAARHVGASGVLAVCAGTVHGAVDVQKVHTYQLDAFSSGDAGPIAYVEEGALRVLRDWPRLESQLTPRQADAIIASKGAGWPQVEIVMNHAGAGGVLVDALQAHGVRGIVAACTGNGTLHHALEAALLRAQAAGIDVRRATRCTNGRVLPKPGDAIADSAGLSPVKARVALMLELMARN